ncbi:MAG: hypothetical protein DDT37_01476 [Firmicutes bacterium]|nr:hypothetical protein [candidate division NPL-UPA2 bacterium]
MGAGRVDDRLLVRQEVQRKLVELANAKLTPAELEKALRHLAAQSPYTKLGALKLLEETSAEREASVAVGLLIALGDSQAMDGALSLLHKRNVADVAKGQLLRFLATMGCDPSDIMTPAVFRDINKLASESMELLLKDIADDESIIGYVLEEFAGFPPEMQFGYVQDLVHTRDKRVIPLLYALARGDDEVIASEAVKGLGTIAEARSLGVLNQVRDQTEALVRRLAERESRRLSFKGIVPEYAPSKMLGDLVHVAVSGIDGQGCRIVWVARFLGKGRGRLIAANFLLSLEQGLKDCYGTAHTTRRESAKMRKTLKRSHPLVEGDLAYATLLVRDALFVSQRQGLLLPPQWTYWKSVLGTEELTPKQYVPQPEEWVGDSAMETALPELLTLEELAEWYEEDPLVYDAAEEIMKIRRRFRSGKAKTKAADDVLRKAATALFQPRLPEIIRRLDLTGEFLSRRGKTASAGMLLRIARELQSGQPPEHNAFLRDLLVLSVRVAEHNLKAGYDLRRTPDGLE